MRPQGNELWYNSVDMTNEEIKAFFSGRAESADWYDITDPFVVMNMPMVDISAADRLRDRKEMKRVFHAFGRVVNESDGRVVVFPSASVGKMWYMSGIDVRNMAAEFANLFRKSIRGWSEPNKKIPEEDKRRKMERVHQYITKFKNAQGEFVVRFTVKENIGGSQPRAEVHASVISRISIYKTKGAELSTPIKTRAEDPAPFVDNKIALFLSAVNGVA